MTFPAPQERAPGCASDLDLDEILSGDLAGQPKEARLRAHVATCAGCRDRLAAFAAVLPPDPARILPRVAAAGAGTARPARRRVTAVSAAVAFAAAAAIALVVWPGRRPGPGEGGDVERTKGSAALTLLVKRTPGTASAPGAIESITGEGTLRPGDEIRFSLASARPGYAVVLGLDAAPAVTIYAPTAPGVRSIRIEGTGVVALPGSIVADATPGTERIVALVCAAEPDPEALRARAAAALTAAGGKPERVSALGTGCVESSVLVRKEPSPR